MNSKPIETPLLDTVNDPGDIRAFSVAELRQLARELRAETIDLAVHSLKDMPVEETPGLALASYLKRSSANDALVLRKGLKKSDLAGGLTLGCGSPRRMNQLLALFPKTQFKNIRGNKIGRAHV